MEMDQIKTKEPAAPEAMDNTKVQPIGAEQLKKFAPDFIYGKMAFGLSRKQNIDNLKIMLRGGGGVFADYCYGATGGGLTLANRGGENIARTWTDVFDMLAAIAINELGKGVPNDE